MKNRIYAILLALVAFVGVCLMGACGGDKDEQEELTEHAQTFVDAVDAIRTPITSESGSAIDAAYIAYSFLDEFERGGKTVTAKKQTLDGYQTQYVALKGPSGDGDGGQTQAQKQEALIASFISAVDALPAVGKLTTGDRAAIDSAYVIYNQLTAESKEKVASAYATLVKADNRVKELEEIEQQEEWQRTAEEFIQKVVSIDGVTLQTGPVLEDLLYEYSRFPDGVKSIGGMAEAKALLDDLYAQYQVLRDIDDIRQFVAAVNAIGEVTLNSEGAIRSAETIYTYMSDNAKADNAVTEAYAILTAARAKFDELFEIAETERIQKFIDAVNAIPTDIENIDISWYSALEAAREAYFALTYKSMLLPEVEEAFERWDAVQSAFDKKNYKQIPAFSVNIVYSDDYPPYIVMQLFVENTASVREFYGVSTNAELNKYAALYLDVYVDGEYIAKAELNMSTLTNGFILTGVNNILKGLSADNPRIVSGANFSFAVHIEDRSNSYIPTIKTKVSEHSYNYTW